MADANPRVGNLVQTQDSRQGTVRYVGPLKIAAGEWLGLELSDETGKNDGSVKGERYFTCPPGYGIFVRKESIVKIISQRVPSTTAVAKTNGGTNAPATAAGVRQRSANGITAEVARRRQSMMSAGSGGAGSRLSTRSPTKSPVKPVLSSSTSTTSTPRTGTPAATTRPSDSSTKPRMSVGPKLPVAPRSVVTRTTSSTARQSMNAPTAPPNRASRPVRPSIGAHRSSLQAKSSSRQEEAVPKLSEQNISQSPRMEEDQEETDLPEDLPQDQEAEQIVVESIDEEEPEEVPPTNIVPISETVRKVPVPRNVGGGSVESRAAQQREVEELKAKLRTLEKKRHEDVDRLKQIEAIQSERDKFEKIMQALQKKLNSNHQETISLRARCEQAETKANAPPEPSAEHETEIELATLDKEMAEERAENLQAELEALKSKHEELELENDILKEENRELGSVMTPEEKANAGWLQMERERQRLREALVMLRDMSQQTEMDLKSEIQELSENLEEVEATANMYTETAEKLDRAEETNRHLMEQLEAADTNDEVVEAMEAQREQQLSTIDKLKRQIQDLEEHIQVTDELEIFHIDEEKRLHVQLDDTEASLNERNRQSLEQERVVQDLEYTLTKFRDVVQGLQNDIDELRRSKGISEIEASEMSSKSRAMMDLNLRLQTNAAKTQTKVIDTKLDRVRADLASKHVEILNFFTLESFEAEKNSVLALLCFGRVRAKANLLSRLLCERLRERAHLSHAEEIFQIYNVMEITQWIAGACQRFDDFLESCDRGQFTACSIALYELEPVERTITAWLEALKRDELGPDQPEHFKRMQGVLLDLADKLIAETSQSKSSELLAQTQMVEHYADSLAGQIDTLAKLVQSKLGEPTDMDEDSVIFDKKMNQVCTKARTVKYVSSKAVQQVDNLKGNSICVGESSWSVYSDAERQAGGFVERFRQVSLVVAGAISGFANDQPLSYALVTDTMLTAWKQRQRPPPSSQNGTHVESDIFAVLASQLASLQSVVDDLMVRSNDTHSTIEFDVNPSPWIVRAKELKAQKVIAPETQEELSNLNRRNIELGSRITEREKMIEEMGLRVELAEKRMKESRARDDKDKAIKDELDRLRSEKELATKTLSDLQAELNTLTQKSETDKTEIEALRRATGVGDTSTLTTGTSYSADSTTTTNLQHQIYTLNLDISHLQSTIRHLHLENHTLRVPTSSTLLSAVKNNWLDPSTLSPLKPSSSHIKNKSLQKESQDLYSSLIHVATSLKPIRLSSSVKRSPVVKADVDAKTPTTSSSWRPTHQTTRYAVLKQREELAEWEAWRADLIERAKIAVNTRGGTRVRLAVQNQMSSYRGGRDRGGDRPHDGGGNSTVRDHVGGFNSVQMGGKVGDDDGDGVVTIVDS